MCHKCNAIISSLNQVSTAPVLVFQIMFYWASLHVCVLSYPLQLPEVQFLKCLLSLATKWKRVKRGVTANTGYCLSFQEHPCMLTVTWRPEVSWREAVCLSRLQSVLSSSSILSSFFLFVSFVVIVSSTCSSLTSYLSFHFLQTLTNAQHRRRSVAYNSIATIHWAPTVANTITAAVRVWNQFISCSYSWSTCFPGI